ncbi:hypothetical protein [Cupriavidus campinensis]
MTKNKAASVAQLTDEQIDALYFQCVSDSCVGKSFRHAFARAVLAQASPPAAPAAPASEQVVYELYGISDIMRGSAQQDEREAVTDAMVYAFHRSMSDGSLGEADFNEIRDGLRAAMQAARQVTDAAPIYQWRGSSDAWIDCDAAKYAEVGHGIANAKPGTYGSSWERRIVYASQQVQADAGTVDDAARFDYLGGIGSHQVREIALLAENEYCGDIRAAIDASLSREQPQPSNGDREGGAV